MPIESQLQRLLVDYLKGIGVSQRKFADETGVSETTFGTYNRMTSAMGVDLLDKILTTYPGARAELIKYLGGNTEKNNTSVDKANDNKQNDFSLKAAAFKEVLDTYTDYTLIPKSLLENHRLISKEQMERDERILTKLFDVIEKQHLEIANLRSKVAVVEKGQKNT